MEGLPRDLDPTLPHPRSPRDLAATVAAPSYDVVGVAEARAEEEAAVFSSAWQDVRMETAVEIRRVRADEWREVRDSRLEALQDPLAPLAFLETFEGASAEPDEFWQARAAGGAEGSRVAQWVAIVDGAWVGTVAVMAFRAGEVDYYGAEVSEPRANLVGVYVRPTHRRQGLLEGLVATAASWTAEQGFAELALDVHELNARAIGAYRRCGFEIAGERTVTEHGTDLVMRLPLG